MYSIGLATAFLYLGSVASFLLGVQFTDYSKLIIGLSAVLFIAATVIMLVMLRQRMEKQDF